MTYYIDMEIFDLRIFDKLNFKDKAILYLMTNGYKTKEIAKIFDTSHVNLKQRMYNMKKKVRGSK